MRAGVGLEDAALPTAPAPRGRRRAKRIATAHYAREGSESGFFST